MSNPETFGEVLAEFMAARNLRDKDMSEKTGLTARFIGRMRSGERHPGRTTLGKLIRALDLYPHEENRLMYATGYSGRDTVLFNDPLLGEINALMPHLLPEARPLVMSALRLAYSRAYNGRRLPPPSHEKAGTK